MPGSSILPSLMPLVASFAECFTAPSYRSFQHLLVGWILCTGRHTVTGVLRASGAIAVKHYTSFHRFFRLAVWSRDQVGLSLLRLVMAFVLKGQCVVVPLDDTLGRHAGKHIRAAGMHHDPLLSTRRKTVFHFGHVWVVLSVLVRVPKWDKSFALPVLCRLYRSKKTCERERRPFFKKTELAGHMLRKLAETFPNRRFCIVGDADYVGHSVFKALPENVDLVGRSRLDAAVYALPKPQRMGRPRVKGERLPSPAARARSGRGWKTITVEVYGRAVTLKVKVFDALWYKAARGRLLRFVLVRDWPGHDHDDVFVSTDLNLSAGDVIRRQCQRWALEVTFHEVKGRLGFEDPQNRTDAAVERTAPMALWVYTLTVLWFLGRYKRRKTYDLPRLPWYEKSVPAFSDMLAALRQRIWRHRLLDLLPRRRRDQKSVEPLLDAVAYAA